MTCLLPDGQTPFTDAWSNRWFLDTGNAISWSEQSAEHWVRVLGRQILKLDIKDRSDGKVDTRAGHFTRRLYIKAGEENQKCETFWTLPPSGDSILLVNGLDYFMNFLSRLSGAGSEEL